MARKQGTIYLNKKPSSEKPKSVIVQQAPIIIPQRDEKEKLQSLIDKTHRVIFRAKTVFPFDFFPDEIIIDQNKIDIVINIFFSSSDTVTIPFKIVQTAHVSTDLFFGTLTLNLEFSKENPVAVRFLTRTDAIKAKRIINGLAICEKENIDLSKFDIEDIREKVEEIGKTRDR